MTVISAPMRDANITTAATGNRPVTAPAVRVTAADLDDWAMGIDIDGIRAHEEQARRVVGAASRLGLCPVLVDVLADPTEPAVARERAFGRLAQSLTLLAR